MKHEIKIPTVGESISEVTIAQWLKKDGDYVQADELICEIESDKASFEIPAENSGILHTLAKEGDTVDVGTSIAEIDTNGKAAAATSTKTADVSREPGSNDAVENSPVEKAATAKTSGDEAGTVPSGKSQTFTIVVPTVGESITEVTLSQWLKADGAIVQPDELLCEIESDKASFEIPAENGGVLKQLVKEGETIEVGTAIAEITGGGGSATASAIQTTSEVVSRPKVDAQTSANGADHHPKISPVAQNILNEAGIPAEKVRGSGPGGRITKDDAKRAVENSGKPQPAAATPATAAPQTTAQTPPSPAPQPATVSGDRNISRKRMSTLRKTIAKRLVAAKNETAMLTTFNEADMTAIMNLRKLYKEIFKEKYEIGLGFMSFFSKAVCLAVRDWPAVNAQIDSDQIVYHDFVDISIAVSTPKGLVVPVIRNAEQLSLAGIEREVRRLALKARDGKLTIEEMTGGTFTITNGGVFGSLMSTPIINAPQSAILGMHKIQERAMVIDGQVQVRPMMYLALSYDHRIVDGRESVGFLVRVKELLEDPARMLIEV